jgi:hypothetical protein
VCRVLTSLNEQKTEFKCLSLIQATHDSRVDSALLMMKIKGKEEDENLSRMAGAKTNQNYSNANSKQTSFSQRTE